MSPINRPRLDRDTVKYFGNAVRVLMKPACDTDTRLRNNAEQEFHVKKSTDHLALSFMSSCSLGHGGTMPDQLSMLA
jgi:predicted glycosyltransferase